MGKISLVKGVKAEELAAEYIKKIGYQILYQNWKCLYGEIDIIGIKEENIAFFEVKYRRDNEYGYPFEFINRSKITKLKKTINLFLIQSHLINKAWTLEGLCISLLNNKYKLIHYHNILDLS